MSQNQQKLKELGIKQIGKNVEQGIVLSGFECDYRVFSYSGALCFDILKLTPDGFDLRLSYPKVHDKYATQLIVMNGDKIEKSFYIINNKLLRFNIEDLNDKFYHDNRPMYYYDTKYLEESNLKMYLELLRDKFRDVNEKMENIKPICSDK